MTVRYVFEFIEEQTDGHMLVRETRDEVIDRINKLAKNLMKDNKDYQKYIIRNKNNHSLIIKGINDLVGSFVNIIEIRG